MYVLKKNFVDRPHVSESRGNPNLAHILYLLDSFECLVSMVYHAGEMIIEGSRQIMIGDFTFTEVICQFGYFVQ